MKFLKFSKVLSVLTGCVCVMALTGCKKQEEPQSDSSADSPVSTQDAVVDDGEVEEITTPVLTENSVEKIPQNQTKSDGTSDIHVTVESVEVTLDELKAQDYVVPVMITIDENSGISYAEWGVLVDERCKYTADNRKLDYSVYYSINEEENFMWTAWSAGADILDDIGNLLKLEVIIPEDAAVGDSYGIKYQAMSLAEKPHVWSTDADDWVRNGYISWTDGGITIVDQKTVIEPEQEVDSDADDAEE
ncbi:MAG: hypothetical protein K2H89_06635 [Oscillospiraceae bacterium]|nr:hypothetical protein [Oscillospiraceae bacterium]